MQIGHIFLVVFRIHPDAPDEPNHPIDDVGVFALSNSQQTILEKLINEPIVETEIETLFEGDVNDDLGFLVKNDLVAIKQIPDSKLFFITPKGKNALKSSF